MLVSLRRNPEMARAPHAGLARGRTWPAVAAPESLHRRSGRTGALQTAGRHGANTLAWPSPTCREMEFPHACLEIHNSKCNFSSVYRCQLSDLLPSFISEIASCLLLMGWRQTWRLPSNKGLCQVESLFSSWPRFRVRRLCSSSSSKLLPR